MGAVLPLALAAVLAAVSGARALPADTKPPATLTTPSTSHTAPPSPPALRAQPLLEEEEDQPHLDYYDEDRINISQKGMYLGSPCESSCSSKLVHVYCEPSTLSCQCDPKHPVALGPAKGCARPKKLGEQCFYRATCRAFDPHASCVQVNHNAYCQCEPGYHSTTHTRPVPRNFCTEDMVVLTADMPTLLGVASGIFVLAGLLCMVLHLYTRARYHPTHLADARLTPPCLYSLNDTGSRRPSLNSVQSSSSSIRSYSAKRWEREREQKERRQMSMRLAQLHDKMAAGREPPRLAPTPSPRSPNNSTDGLLPAVCEIRELITNSDQQLQGVDGPCSSTSLY
ncbi:PREDICTED: uncharacterized protein LOC106103815 isoform X2 [Papilio polytes]|uniref:uncharacterized protein LOC106103815 isoform X2 n=1 Tax=Papilio polytes TaxID=76194 RepID=UPI00067673DA|nr:PREDICTED: uncharacterized protein LOC106103815 isoform X2 [Papilio polytes]